MWGLWLGGTLAPMARWKSGAPTCVGTGEPLEDVDIMRDGIEADVDEGRRPDLKEGLVGQREEGGGGRATFAVGTQLT